MPRLVEKSFPPEFADQRDALLGVVRRGVSKRSAALERAAARLESEYPDAAVRARIKQQQTSRASRSGGSAAGSVGQSVTVNRVRAERLAWAMQDAVAAVQRQDHENPLGPHLKKGAREANAMFYIVLAGLVLDPDIEEWLGGITEMSRCPWSRAKRPTAGRKHAQPPRLTGYFDRGAVFGDWGHQALQLLEDSCKVLDWSAAPTAPASEVTDSPRPAAIPMRVIPIDMPLPDPPRTLDAQIGAVRAAFDRFYQVLDAMTVRCDGGRRVDGVPQAMALSEATTVLHSELGFTYGAIVNAHGQPLGEPPPGIMLKGASSPQGPWTPIPASMVRAHHVKLGSSGADAILMATLERASRVASFETARWNARQNARRGPHQRWQAGDIVTTEELDILDSAVKSLKLLAPPPSPGGRPAGNQAQPQGMASAIVAPNPVEVPAAADRKKAPDATDEEQARSRASWPTGGELTDAAAISDDTFRRIRTAAEIDDGTKGAESRRRRYSPDEVTKLRDAVVAGNTIKRVNTARVWEKWTRNQAASKPHGSK